MAPLARRRMTTVGQGHHDDNKVNMGAVVGDGSSPPKQGGGAARVSGTARVGHVLMKEGRERR